MKITICVLAAWLGVVAALWQVHGARYNWDEVQYVEAAALGTVANAVERGSLSIGDFIAFAKAKKDHARVAYPVGYSEENDPLILRHYHPPLVTWLVAWMGDSHNERVGRAAQLLGAGALIAAAAVSCQALAGSTGIIGLLIAVTLAAWLAAVSFTSLSFHGWEAVWSIAVAATLMKTLEASGKALVRWRVVAGLCVACAALTLESGAFVAVGGLTAMLIRRRWRDAAIVGAVCIAAVLVLWPGILLRGSLIKIAALYAYRIKLGHEYAAGFSLSDIALAFSPFALAVAVSAGWLSSRSRRDGGFGDRALPFVTVGCAYLLAMLKFVLDPIYLAPGWAPFIPLVGAVIERAWSARQRSGPGLLGPQGTAAALAATGVAAILSLWASSTFFRDQHWFNFDRHDAEYQTLAEVLRGRTAVLDGGHIYSYSFGPAYKISSLTQGYDHRSLLMREGGEYRPMAAADVAGRIVGVQDNRKLEWPFLEQGLLSGCSRQNILGLRLYDCGPGR